MGILTEKPTNKLIQIKNSRFSKKKEFKIKSKDELPLLK